MQTHTLVCEEGQNQVRLEGRFRANITASATTCTMELATETVLDAPRNGIALVWTVPIRPERAGPPDPVTIQFEAR